MIVDGQLAAGDLRHALGNVLAEELARGAFTGGVGADELNGIQRGVGAVVGRVGGGAVVTGAPGAAGGEGEHHGKSEQQGK